MELSHKVPLAPARSDGRVGDLAIVLSYTAVALAMLIAIYLAGNGPGTAAADFINMTVFP